MLAIIHVCSAQSLVWERLYGGPVDQMAFDIAMTHDGNYVAVGHRSQPSRTPLLMKLTPQGDTLWTRVFPYVEDGQGVSVAACSDGTALVAANFTDQLFPSDGILLIKTDAVGDTIWTRKLTSKGHLRAEKVLPLGNKFVLLATHTLADSSRVVLSYHDSIGVPIWTTEVHSGMNTVASDMLVGSDLTFQVFGSEFGADTPYFIRWLVSSQGQCVSTLEYTYPRGAYSPCATLKHDSKVLLATEVPGPSNNNDVEFYLLDSLGTVLIRSTYATPKRDVVLHLRELEDGTFVAIGYQHDPLNSETSDLLVVRLREDLSVVSSLSLLTPESDMGNVVVPRSDGTGMVIGNRRMGMFHYNILYSSLALSNLTVVQTSNVKPTSLTVELFPNPANPNSVIQFSVPEETDVSLSIYDLAGRRILTQFLTNVLPGTHKISLPTLYLSSGTYFLKLATASDVATSRLVFIK